MDLLHVPLCRHDHGLKHAGGWRLGRTYHARHQPITTDLLGPLPRPEQYPDYVPPVTVDENWPILHRPPPKPDSRPPPARAVDPDEPPPF